MQGGSTLGDAEWVKVAIDGDGDAFARLVERYQRPVFSLCLRMLGTSADAEDAAQETFVRAYRNLRRYDAQRPFGTWLLSIASHLCIDRLRRRKLNVVSLDALPVWRRTPAIVEDPEGAAERAVQADHVAMLLGTLPADYRIVVVLRYWHDFGYAEIAAILGESESAIKSRLHRARRLLAQALHTLPESRGDGRAQSTTGELVWTVAPRTH